MKKRINECMPAAGRSTSESGRDRVLAAPLCSACPLVCASRARGPRGAPCSPRPCSWLRHRQWKRLNASRFSHRLARRQDSCCRCRSTGTSSRSRSLRAGSMARRFCCARRFLRSRQRCQPCSTPYS